MLRDTFNQWLRADCYYEGNHSTNAPQSVEC